MNKTWKRYVKYLYFDGKLPRTLDRRALVAASYEIVKDVKARVRRVGEEAPDNASFSVIEFMVPGFNQVNMVYDGTIAAFSWPTDNGWPQFIDCPPLAESLAKHYPDFFVAPRAELMAKVDREYLNDLLPSDRKLIISNELETVGDVIYHVVVTE